MYNTTKAKCILIRDKQWTVSKQFVNMHVVGSLAELNWWSPWSSDSSLDSKWRVELSMLLWGNFYFEKNLTSLVKVVPSPIQPL